MPAYLSRRRLLRGLGGALALGTISTGLTRAQTGPSIGPAEPAPAAEPSSNPPKPLPVSAAVQPATGAAATPNCHHECTSPMSLGATSR
jgi:hypothetical protein